jgi:hypothetical protein
VGYGLTEGTGACVVGPAAVGAAFRVGLAAAVDGRVAAFGVVAFGVASGERPAPGAGEAVAAPVFRRVDAGDGENIAGSEDEELVHAETVAKTKTVKVAQLTTVSLAPPAVPRGVMRTFMKPPLCPASDGIVSRPRHRHRDQHRKRIRAASRSLPRAS